MQEICTSGSVGALGGQPPRATRQDPNNNSAAEGLAAKRAKAVGAVSQATGQLHGALQGVDAVEPMVADVQGGTAVLAGVALDIEHRAPGGGKPYPRAGRDAWQSLLAWAHVSPHPTRSA